MGLYLNRIENYNLINLYMLKRMMNKFIYNKVSKSALVPDCNKVSKSALVPEINNI